jgi:hypothetical protein
LPIRCQLIKYNQNGRRIAFLCIYKQFVLFTIMGRLLTKTFFIVIIVWFILDAFMLSQCSNEVSKYSAAINGWSCNSTESCQNSPYATQPFGHDTCSLFYVQIMQATALFMPVWGLTTPLNIVAASLLQIVFFFVVSLGITRVYKKFNRQGGNDKPDTNKTKP